MPASRRPRATTLIPRSWPSRPTLARTTRGGRGVVIGGPCSGASCRGPCPRATPRRDDPLFNHSSFSASPSGGCPSSRLLSRAAGVVGQRSARLLTGWVQPQRLGQPAYPLALLAVLQEQQPHLATQRRVIGRFHHRPGQPLQPLQIRLNSLEPGPIHFRCLLLPRSEQAPMQDIVGLPVVRGELHGLSQPCLRSRQLALVQRELSPLDESVRVLVPLRQEFVEQPPGLVILPQSAAGLGNAQSHSRPARVARLQVLKMLQGLLRGTGGQQGAGQLQPGRIVVRVMLYRPAVVLQRIGKVEETLPDKGSPEERVQVVGPLLQVAVEALQRALQTVRVDVELNEDFKDG